MFHRCKLHKQASKVWWPPQVISTSGDTHLGGEDFDHRVMDYFMKLVKKKYKVDISQDNRALQKLRREAERAKRALSSQHQVGLPRQGRCHKSNGDNVVACYLPQLMHPIMVTQHESWLNWKVTLSPPSCHHATLLLGSLHAMHMHTANKNLSLQRTACLSTPACQCGVSLLRSSTVTTMRRSVLRLSRWLRVWT